MYFVNAFKKNRLISDLFTLAVISWSALLLLLSGLKTPPNDPLKKPASYESSLELAVHFNAIVIPNFLLSLDIDSL